MKLYIRQRILSFNDKYDVTDEYQNVVFRIQSHLFSFPKEFVIYDTNNMEILRIQEHLTLLFKKFDITSGGLIYATVKQELAFFKSRFSIDSQSGNYEIEGDIFGFDFEVKRNNLVQARICKKYFAFSDSYEIDIYDNESAAMMCAFLTILDYTLHRED